MSESVSGLRASLFSALVEQAAARVGGKERALRQSAAEDARSASLQHEEVPIVAREFEGDNAKMDGGALPPGAVHSMLQRRIEALEKAPKAAPVSAVVVSNAKEQKGADKTLGDIETALASVVSDISSGNFPSALAHDARVAASLAVTQGWRLQRHQLASLHAQFRDLTNQLTDAVVSAKTGRGDPHVKSVDILEAVAKACCMGQLATELYQAVSDLPQDVRKGIQSSVRDSVNDLARKAFSPADLQARLSTAHARFDARTAGVRSVVGPDTMRRTDEDDDGAEDDGAVYTRGYEGDEDEEEGDDEGEEEERPPPPPHEAFETPASPDGEEEGEAEGEAEATPLPVPATPVRVHEASLAPETAEARRTVPAASEVKLWSRARLVEEANARGYRPKTTTHIKYIQKEFLRRLQRSLA